MCVCICVSVCVCVCMCACKDVFATRQKHEMKLYV